MASCLNGPTASANSYQNFDVENNVSSDHGNTGAHAAQNSHVDSSRSTGRPSRSYMIISLVTLLFSTIALILAIYAAVRATRGLSDTASGVVLTSNPGSVPAGYKAVHMYQGTGYFAKLQPMLYPRSDHHTFPIGNTVYLVGGITNGLEVEASEGNATAATIADAGALSPLVLNATVAYNTYTEASTQMADMLEPRYRFCGAVLNGQLYIVGGLSEYEPPTAANHVALDTAMRFNPATNSWQMIQGKLRHPRSDCCAAVVGGKLYVAGGWTTDYTDTLGSVEVYDPVAGAWSFAPNLTVPRGDCEAASLEDRLYVLGGYDAAGSFTASLEALHTAAPNPAWTPRASMLIARGDFAAEALPGGRIIVMGGETSNGTASEFAMHQVEEYIANDDVWVSKAPLPEARFRFDTAHVGERVYVFGGQPTCASGEKGDGAKQACVKVALDTVWGYFDVDYPDVYVVVNQ